MKKIVSIAFAVALMLSLVSVASADVPAPGTGFLSAFRVQNLGGSNATCNYVFYDSAGTAAFTSSASVVAPGDSLYVYTGDASFSGLASDQYSAVVSCDQPVAAVVNFSDADSGASHSGITADQLSNIWYAPGIYDNFYNYYSNIVVQNASGGSVNVTVEIFAPGNPVAVKTQSATGVPNNASVSFEQENAAELNQDVAYSAKITATGDVAPVVNIYGRAGVDNQLYSYNPFSAGSTTAYAPVIMNNFFGNNTSLVIQNIDTTDANVDVDYGTGQSTQHTIPPGSAVSLYTPLQSGGVPDGALTGATVVSTNGKQIVVLVNESNPFNRAASYSGFAGGTDTVRAPIVMKRYFTYNTSVTCQNIGAAATVMTLTYGGVAGSNVSPSINPGGTHLFYQPIDGLISDGFIGSATISASGGQDIVCVVNEDANEPPEGSQIKDFQYAYNGIND